MRAVTVRRWEVALSFAILTAVFTVLIVWLQHTSDAASDAAAEAKRASAANTRALERSAAVRAELVEKIHRQDMDACQARHVLYVVLRDSVRRSLNESVPLLATATVRNDPALRASLLRSIERARNTLIRLEQADCTGIPPLVAKPGRR